MSDDINKELSDDGFGWLSDEEGKELSEDLFRWYSEDDKQGWQRIERRND